MALRDFLGRTVSTYGSLMGIPNLGASQAIAGQAQPVKPFGGLQQQASFSGSQLGGLVNPVRASGPVPGSTGPTGYPIPGTFRSTTGTRPSGDTGGGTTDGGGGGNNGLDPHINPSTGQWDDNYYAQKYAQGAQQAPQQPMIDYDAMIAPALQALDEALVPAQSEYGANVASVEASRQRGKGQLQASLGEAQTTGVSQKKQLTGQTESAIDEARRQFSEIQQGLQARYGRTTGTGGFASTYLGGQTLRNISQQRSSLTTAIQSIDDRLAQVKSVTDIAVQDIDQQAEAQKLQVKSQLDNALQQIRQAKGQLLSQKAQLAQQAMQFYQQQVQQVNANNVAFKQQLMRDQMAAEQKLAEAKQRAASEIKKFQAVTVGSADTGYFGSAFDPQKGTFSSSTPLTTGGGSLNFGGQGYRVDENGNIIF